MTAPRRVQRSRAAGSRLPQGAVYVGRGSRWGNPFDKRGQAVRLHAEWLDGAGSDEQTKGSRTYSRSDVLDHVAGLAGKTLACWCPVDGPCHSDTLVRLAARACNATTETRESTWDAPSPQPATPTGDGAATGYPAGSPRHPAA